MSTGRDKKIEKVLNESIEKFILEKNLTIGAEDSKKYLDLIEKEYLKKIIYISKKKYIEEAFKIAYLILFFHNSKKNRDSQDILLGDLFISILNSHLLPIDRELLKKLTNKITFCYSKEITSGKCDYKEELLKLLRKVS
ncbi:MAG: hypothetical protein WBG30_05270 [Psychrilyobacter sp.]|uniref:hypothetical protein n=1 Tax=Psychrilyobacter sp. TaxID=2586924 RepID=UPI003C7419E5